MKRLINMNKKKNIILFIILICLLCYIYKKQKKISKFSNFIYKYSFFISLSLLLCIIFNTHVLKDIFHFVLIVSMICISPFIDNKALISYIIFFFILTLFFWKFDGGCPLGSYDNIPLIKNFIKNIDELKLSYPIIISSLLMLIYKLVKIY
jgi:hypothetical protein